MTSKLTRERIELIANFHRAMTLPPSHDEIEELARIALSAMDSEPHTDDELSNLLWYSQEATCHSDPNYYFEFQRLATPGFIASIIRELQERRKAELDSEPVAYTEQHEISNMHATGLYLRAWPADRARNAVEGYTIPLYRHAQQAPERDQVRREHAEWSQATFGNVGPIGPLKHLSKEALEAAAEPCDLSEWADMQFLLWDAQHRAGITDEQITQAMIEKLAVNKQREWPAPKDGEPRLHIKGPTFDKYSHSPSQAIDVLEVAIFGEDESCRAAMLQAGNSPVIPDGYVMVPKEPTQAMYAAFNDSDYGRKSLRERYIAMLAAAPQEVK